ncbi:hypothetical protein OHS58_18490 [Amycolatopsis sp. NBC_00348]|uniref:hypothetical protein n=1 Tax=Amycolatopsis sp. NBC_00348 TaxID=2975956 RepID=UPI002E271067
MIMVTAAEQDVARRWLARRGQPVGRPTPLVTALIATRLPFQGRRFWRFIVYAVVAAAAARVYSLPFEPWMTGIFQGYFVYFALGLSFSDGIRLRERELREEVPSTHAPDPWWRVLGGWYIAALVLAFAGGAGLAGAIYFTTSARTYAVSWLVLLVLSALYVGWVLAGVLRRPLVAEDATSLAVARAMRTEHLVVGTPVLAVFPLVSDLLLGNRRPPAFTPWVAGYVVAVVILQVVSCFVNLRRHRTLPPGHYGTPPVQDPGTPVDWSPPREAR